VSRMVTRGQARPIAAAFSAVSRVISRRASPRR